MKFFQSARRFRSAIVLLLLASLLIWRHFFALPFICPGQSVTLTAYNGETTQQKLIYTWQDMLKFHFTLLTAGARPAQLQQHADASQPVYGLSVAGVRKDFDAVVWDGLWIDNSGRVLSTDLDLSSLWEQLSVDTHTREGMSSLPCLRELALLSGQWDCRFLPAGSLGTPRADVPMILSSPAGHTLEWSVSNQSNDALLHGNSGSAGLEVLLDGLWYGVPWKTDLNYGVTAESYTLEPGGRTSISQLPQHYGDGFPDGRYRIVFHYHIYDRKTDTYQDAGFSAAEFQIQDSLFFCPDIS